MRRPLALFCCVSLAAIAYAGANYAGAPSDPSPVLPNEESGLHHVIIPDLSLQHPPISQLRGISDRPLFTPSRRPTPTAEKVQVDAYRLRGVLVASTGKIGLVERIDDGTLLRVSEGDIVDVWRVSSIGRNSITWSRLDRSDDIVVSKIWEDGAAPSSEGEPALDSLRKAISENDGPNEEANTAWHLNTARGQTGEARVNRRRHVADDAADSNPIYGLVMPTAPLPPTPTAPRHWPKQRLSSPKSPS